MSARLTLEDHLGELGPEPLERLAVEPAARLRCGIQVARTAPTKTICLLPATRAQVTRPLLDGAGDPCLPTVTYCCTQHASNLEVVRPWQFVCVRHGVETLLTWDIRELNEGDIPDGPGMALTLLPTGHVFIAAADQL